MPDNLLIVADSEHDANMRYAVRLFVPDPFIYLRMRGRCHIVLNDLEVDRGREQAPHCKVLSLTECMRALRPQRGASPGTARVIQYLLRKNRISRVFVPATFPLGLADELRALGVVLKVRPGVFFPERERKSAEEVKKISAALMMAEVGLAEGVQALKAAKVGRARKLVYRNNPFTSEKLRAIIDTAILQAGGLPANTIVAGGAQSCDPHERGSGVLRAGEPIIIDVFPRSQKTGFFGDITRTFVKGRASEAVRALYHAVLTAQEVAFSRLRRNAKTADVHNAVVEHFDRHGFRTAQVNGRMHGFFHSTGHGLGMDIHETPRLSGNSKETLRSGHVVTVEPGLYYPGIGGVRLEDVAHVTASTPRNLTKFEKQLEL